MSRYDHINDAAHAEQLIARIRSGDDAAFDRLFRLCYAALADMALRYVANRADAEDIATDVLVWVWERRDTLDIHGLITAYLFRAVRNRALNLRVARREARTSDTLSDDISGTITDGRDDPMLMIEAAELSVQMRRVLETLPPRAREIFLLSRRDGLSIREVAAVLGVTASTVQTQLTRALHVLRSAVDPTR